ncbi:hypothetical protein GQ43DRAFT_477322 [Delitschia confertaspora ATCC 74209]|uniref:Vacuolar membrane-associated protein IML1 n=1 Tax=Delitschia confertaspora ATCC 74209 TaxID=1513339 RepID=A0A9P4N345_9PLEO|nr:hypothetical protein GQ43DRAFT_477322 [Delitschia confertaspora ATCC 74209]
MSKSNASQKATIVQKLCTLWTHDDNFSKDDVVFNCDKFTELPTTPGSLIRIIALKQDTAVRDFQSASKPSAKDSPKVIADEAPRHANTDSRSRKSRRQAVTLTLDENGLVIQGGRESDPGKSYIFVAKPMALDLRSKYPNLQVSIAEKIAKVFGFRNRTQVLVTIADEETNSATHVEIAFRDEYLARADMWRMAISELSYRTVYRGQKLLFMGTIKATVKNVYIDGQSRHSGYFSSMTKPVFRSESARYVLFIQMSKEMWDFDTEGAGEIMFNKVVNGFLPDLFKRWIKINAKHLVTIILFTRMHYDDDSPSEQQPLEDDAARYNVDSSGRRFRDYYRVVLSEMASGDWVNILYQLKKEFRAFLRDVSIVSKSPYNFANNQNDCSNVHQTDVVLAGKPAPATHGNVLEAINLVAAQFAQDYIDRDLVRTGISVTVITAGTGVFEVDYNILKLTTDTLVGSGIGIDLVCLSPMPLHSVPLFKYRSPRLVSSLPAELAKSPQKRVSSETSDELNEKTPRQNQPNFGPITRSSANPHPPMLTNDGTTLSADEATEWRYAIPHWVDVSFWSGPSDEILELTNPRKLTNPVTKSRKKGGTFGLRCRMYELQMMGVMESELGNITIPYLEEDPLYPHSLRGYFDEFKQKNTEDARRPRQRSIHRPSETAKVKHDSDKQPEAEKRVLKSWMDAYDGNVFSSTSDRPASQDYLQDGMNDYDLRRTNRTLEKTAQGLSLPPSYDAPTPSLGQSARPPPDTNFHQLMRERSNDVESRSPRSTSIHGPRGKGSVQPRADVLYRQSTARLRDTARPPHQRGNSGDSSHHRGSTYVTPNQSPAISRGNTPPKRSSQQLLSPANSTSSAKSSKPTRPGWFMRHISFGGTGFTAAPATSVDASISSGKVKPARLTVENNQKGVIAAKLASTRNVDVEKPSQPIAIRASREASGSSTSPPSFVPKSVETVRVMPNVKTSITSQPSSVAKDSSSLFLFASSRGLREQVGPKPVISTSGGTQHIPRTLSPTSALSPWAVLVNPCNPKKNHSNIPGQFRRWQHVFPKRLKTSSMKWKSLCSPAAVPLTNEYFPTADQLATEYNESPYKITQDEDDDLMEIPKSRETLVRELIAFRLSHGFQIIIGADVAEFTGGREHDLSNIFHPDYMAKDGDTVFMCVGNTIHQLVCAAGGEVEVKRFSRKPTTALQSSAGIDTPLTYKPLIKTAFDNQYRTRDVILRPPRKEYNWNFIDTFLAGYHDEFSEILRFWRARFVLIPVELPTINRRPLPLLTEDSEEEIRLEGIRKLTQVWQRYRYIPPEERHFQATAPRKQKDPNPLAIEYQTRDPSVIVAAGLDNTLLSEADPETISLFSETDRYHTSNIDLKKLAEDLQGEKGIRMLDRRWHWRLHYNCFLGFDLTSWLLQNFKDVETRDEAVDLGNQLMHKGLFKHVQQKHQFRDGNFFYQIAHEYRAPRPESRTGWFGIRRADRSVPSTPLSEGPRSSPLATGRSTKSRPSTSDSESVSEGSASVPGEKTPTRTPNPKLAVTLSRVMRYDVDPRKRSYRPEIISLHYDRLHNPDNCYHIRIDWMNVTAKLIEDAIVTWATSVEKYGLKLVEVPIAEASSISENHPFRTPYLVELALQPPKHPPEHLYDVSHFGPQAKTDAFAYHKALLRRLNYVLDMEAASCFPSDVDVRYSWGVPDYKYTQFIHRSGTVLIQITDDGNFLLLANRLVNNRASTTRDASSRFRTGVERMATAISTVSTPNERASAMRSPFSSPLARPVQDSSLLHTQFSQPAPASQPPPTPHIQTPEEIKKSFEAFCSDPVALKSFYDEAFRRQAPSPSPKILGTVLGGEIPSLGLPPAIRIGEASWREGGVSPGAERTGAGGGGWSLAGMRDRRRGSLGPDAMAGAMNAAKRQGSEGASAERGIPKRQESGGSVGSG